MSQLAVHFLMISVFDLHVEWFLLIWEAGMTTFRCDIYVLYCSRRFLIFLTLWSKLYKNSVK